MWDCDLVGKRILTAPAPPHHPTLPRPKLVFNDCRGEVCRRLIRIMGPVLRAELDRDGDGDIDYSEFMEVGPSTAPKHRTLVLHPSTAP